MVTAKTFKQLVGTLRSHVALNCGVTSSRLHQDSLGLTTKNFLLQLNT